MKSKTQQKVFLAIFVILLITACSSEPDTSRCLPATLKQLDFINYAVQSMQASNSIKDGWAVKSNDYENVYMVATLIYGPAIEEGVGPAVFAVGGDPETPHTWLAVNGYATEFTEFPDAGKTDAEITLNSDGVQEAIDCVKKGE